MAKTDDSNPFHDPRTAREWINTVEGAQGKVREQDIYPRLWRWVEEGPSQRILEIGCGQGICSSKMDLRNRAYTGLDLSTLLIDRAKLLYPEANRRFVVGEATGLPFADGEFDAAFSVAVWFLIEDLQAATRELGRVLKPGGRFLIITANPAIYSMWKEQYVNGKADGKRFEGEMELADKTRLRDVLFLHPLEEIEAALSAAGLQIEKKEYFRVSEKFKGRTVYVAIEGRKKG